MFPQQHSHYKRSIHRAQTFPSLANVFSLPPQPSSVHSLSFLCTFLLVLRRVPSPPPLSPASLQHPAQRDAAQGDNVHDKIDGRPVVDGVVGLQQHEAHAHVVVGPHLQEPVDPVKGALAAGAEAWAHGRLHGRLSGDAQRDGEEGEVVARVKAVPVGADQHGPAGPDEEENRRMMKKLHLSS